MDALYYNAVRLALLRINNPLSLHLASLPGMDIVVDDETWIVSDRSVNDKPLLAWLDFNTRDRNSLITTIPCRINLYRPHSTFMIDKVLEQLYFTINSKLSRQARVSDHQLHTIHESPTKKLY